MTTKRVDPRPLGFELRVFECGPCRVEKEIVTALDPADSTLAGYLNSSLRPPE